MRMDGAWGWIGGTLGTAKNAARRRRGGNGLAARRRRNRRHGRVVAKSDQIGRAGWRWCKLGRLQRRRDRTERKVRILAVGPQPLWVWGRIRNPFTTFLGREAFPQENLVLSLEAVVRLTQFLARGVALQTAGEIWTTPDTSQASVRNWIAGRPPGKFALLPVYCAAANSAST